MRLLSTPEEIENCKILKESWKHPMIPERQWKAIEIERAYLLNNEYWKVPPFATFAEACHRISDRELREEMDVLDVGASCGIYSLILQQAGFGSWSYTALDYSQAFKDFTKKVYPWIHFDLGEMTDLPYSDKTFKIVTINITNLHIEDWQKALDEVFRVARKYVIVHRVPLVEGPTCIHEDDNYGVKMLHTLYNLDDFNKYIDSKTKSIYRQFIPIYDTNQFTVVIEKQ